MAYMAVIKYNIANILMAVDALFSCMFQMWITCWQPVGYPVGKLWKGVEMSEEHEKTPAFRGFLQ